MQGLIEDSAVLPVWTEASGVLTFSKPGKTIIPPTALADAFTKKPDLRPAVLLKGPVLAGEILGSDTRKLLSYNEFLSEMSPQELERVWADGLEDWWNALGVNESERQDLLFHLWAAIYDLTVANEDWITTDLRCVRTDSGAWVSVNEARFFNEALPTEKEPGGKDVRKFIRSSLPDADHCLPSAWIRAKNCCATFPSVSAEISLQTSPACWERLTLKRIFSLQCRSLCAPSPKTLNYLLNSQVSHRVRKPKHRRG